MKKLISFTLFVAMVLLMAAINSLHAESFRERSVASVGGVGIAYPAQRYALTGTYGGWSRKMHPQVWMRGHWVRPRFYRRPAIRMRVW